MKITAPYNFVPLNKDVYYPSWSEDVSQDLPFSDSEDGVVEVTIHSVSPFFTRDGEKQGMYSSHIVGADGKRHYFIPATTIKGMLREIVEIMSFGKMQEGKDYQNRYFGWRNVANSMNRERNTLYQKVAANGKPGWLRKNDTGVYTFSPCEGDIDKIQIVEVKKLFPSYTPDSSIWKVNASVKTEADGKSPAYPQVEQNGQTYRLVCTGKIGGKLHELLFPVDLGDEERLNDETIVAFKTLYENTPGFAEEKVKGQGCYLKALEEGKDIPVFKYVREGKTFLGMSRMFRVPFRYNVKEQTEFIQKPNPDQADFAETLFGYAGKEKSLKGRVMVGHAFMDGYVDDNCLIETSGILGAPKASYYPLYIKQQKSPYKTYDDKSGIAGRKLYRIHKGFTTMNLPQGENKNMGTTFKALPEGQTFRLRIALHNTRPMETGAVLTALTLNGTEGTFFNLGMAKSFGFGKCKVDVDDVRLSGFNHDAMFYMHEFEKEMSVFTYEKIQQIWASTESVTQLVNIHLEHSDDVVKMMDLNDYSESKNEKKNPFNMLQESGKQIHSLLGKEEREDIPRLVREAKERNNLAAARKEFVSYYLEAEQHLELAHQLESSCHDSLEGISTVIGEFEKAKKVYDLITDQLLGKHLSFDAEKSKVADIERYIAHWELEKNKLQQDLVRKGKDAKLQAGLSAVLDKLAGDDKSCSIKDFKVCFQKVDKWLNDKGTAQLSTDEQDVLENTAKRILKTPPKKEKKELKNFDGKQWKRLAKYLGEERAHSLFEYYKGYH